VRRGLSYEGYGAEGWRHYYQVYRLRHLRQGLPHGSPGDRRKVIT